MNNIKEFLWIYECLLYLWIPHPATCRKSRICWYFILNLPPHFFLKHYHSVSRKCGWVQTRETLVCPLLRPVYVLVLCAIRTVCLYILFPIILDKLKGKIGISMWNSMNFVIPLEISNISKQEFICWGSSNFSFDVSPDTRLLSVYIHCVSLLISVVCFMLFILYLWSSLVICSAT